MDDFLELLLEIIVDGAMGAAEDRRVPLWVRILLTAVLLALFLGISGLLIAAGIGTGRWGLIVLGALFLACTAGMAVHKLRQRRKR